MEAEQQPEIYRKAAGLRAELEGAPLLPGMTSEGLSAFKLRGCPLLSAQLMGSCFLSTPHQTALLPSDALNDQMVWSNHLPKFHPSIYPLIHPSIHLF